MTTYYFDAFGWLSQEPIPGRSTTVAPPADPLPDGTAWNFTGHAWVALSTAPVAPPAPPAEDPRLWWLDVGPFYDRFGPDALAIAASDHGACRAVQTLTGVRKYIDLKDPRVSAMIDMLIATQQPEAVPYAPGSGPMTAAKKAAILTTPTSEAERHIKGLPTA